MEMDNHTDWNNESFYEEEDEVGFVVESMIIPGVAGFGLFGNILSIVVLSSPEVDLKVFSCESYVTFDNLIYSDNYFIGFQRDQTFIATI